MRAVRERSLAVKAACAAFGVSETCYRYRAKGTVDNELIVDWLVRLNNLTEGMGQAHLSHRSSWGASECWVVVTLIMTFACCNFAAVGPVKSGKMK